ncbi:hypothetical protein OAN307_c13250 [Octadecabacter antarcticus 307]|uniref:Peptidoglycan binding-like domain-containing protein n=2 Tax=Octadecabacter TaxID=53945 RepID=M9R5G9_9RHOB|nr:hypothetical protein OAN307_c13250 [Octadecabacter antarcticus 307]
MSQFYLATAVMAAPCVSATFDRPLPGATDVVSFVTDVPSVQFPAFWQQGHIGEFSYKIFSNAEGVLRPTGPAQDWSIEISCDGPTQACDLGPEGAPTEDALRIASILGQCLIHADIDKTDFMPPAEPAPVSTPEDVADVIDVQATPNPAPKLSCGLFIINEATDEAVMQRLLVMAGSDPGPVDGFLGPRTFRAMDNFVVDSGWATSVDEVIILLDKLLCEHAE